MEKTLISSHSQLMGRIEQLKLEVYNNEEELKYYLKEFVETLNPVSMLKRSLHHFAEDSEVQYDMAKVGLNFGVNLLIGRIIGKRAALKVF